MSCPLRRKIKRDEKYPLFHISFSIKIIVKLNTINQESQSSYPGRGVHPQYTVFKRDWGVKRFPLLNSREKSVRM